MDKITELYERNEHLRSFFMTGQHAAAIHANEEPKTYWTDSEAEAYHQGYIEIRRLMETIRRAAEWQAA